MLACIHMNVFVKWNANDEIYVLQHLIRSSVFAKAESVLKGIYVAVLSLIQCYKLHVCNNVDPK